MCYTLAVYDIHVELVLSLYGSTCGDGKYILVGHGQDDVACASRMQDVLRIGEGSTQLYGTCGTVYHAAHALHTSFNLIVRSIHQLESKVGHGLDGFLAGLVLANEIEILAFGHAEVYVHLIVV